MLEDLPAIIKYHRKKSGLTQAELAKLAGIGKAAVFDMEHRTKSSRIDTVAKVLKVLNIKVSFDSPLIQAYLEQTREKGKSTRP